MPEGPALRCMPSFPAFYEAINERPPFPWQARLAKHVAETDSWPVEVGVPTGLGKTACLDIAIWWLASQADLSPADRTAPTRIWWLVNRRLLVDSTAEHAQSISNALRDPGAADIAGERALVVRAVADRLRSLGSDPDADPIEVIRLRGGVQSRMPTDPSRPAVVLSTIPMFGSRLLFRGYGSSRSMRPIDAALAGTDSLALVDEAHLASHLIRLVPDLADCTRLARPILGGARSRPQVVSLTATGDASAKDRFDLDAEDEAHPVVQKRLDAAKWIDIQVETRDASKAMAGTVRSLLAEADRPATCLAFANTPTGARAVFDRLRTLLAEDEADILLLTGRAREREAESTRARILDPVHGMAASRDPTGRRARHLIVVATQTLEVGADVDAELLVTETCGVRALTQRLGRLNRLGRFRNSRAVYVHAPPPKTRGSKRKATDKWPVYGDEPGAVLTRLQNAIEESAGKLSVSPRHVSEILGEPGDDPGRAPEILNGLLWEWVKTTTPPEGEAPVEPYFSGIAGVDYSVSLLWRAHVPNDGERLWPRASDREIISVPIGEVRRVLEADGELRRLGPDGITVEAIAVDDLRPGDAVVLGSDRGLLDEFGWNPDSSGAVVDMSIMTRGLPLDARAIERVCGISIGGPINTALGIVPDDEEVDEADQGKAVREIVDALRSTTPHGWGATEWQEVVSALRPEVVRAHREVSRFVLAGRMKQEHRSDELDEMSMAATAIDLDLHGRAVAARSRSIAEGLGLSSDVTGIVEMAGRWHDLGKADRRFQRWLDPSGEADRPIAKSRTARSRWAATRAAAGWPRGGRHEDLSARLVRSWLATEANGMDPNLADLLIHLVISHHGSGRPVVRPVTDATSETVSARIQEHPVEVPASLSEIDWGQPARFLRLHDHWSPWGLALLEAIVRQADHAVSAGARVAGMESR